MKYKIKSFFVRLKRALNWALFIYKQPVWQEYESLLQIIEKRLIDMSVEFETKDITMSSAQDAKRMRLAAKLLGMYREEYYSNKYLSDAFPPDEGGKWNLEWAPGKSMEGSIEAHRRDFRCLTLALRIVNQDLQGWWQ